MPTTTTLASAKIVTSRVDSRTELSTSFSFNQKRQARDENTKAQCYSQQRTFTAVTKDFIQTPDPRRPRLASSHSQGPLYCKSSVNPTELQPCSWTNFIQTTQISPDLCNFIRPRARFYELNHSVLHSHTFSLPLLWL